MTHPLVIPLATFAILTALMFTPGYGELASFLMFYLALAYSFNMFMGMTGYVDFGFVAFLGLGAYGMALGILFARALEIGGVAPIVMGAALGMAMAAALALIVGLIALRLRGAYFAIATIGVNEGIRYFIEGTGIWGGSEGLLLFKPLREIYGEGVYEVITAYPMYGLSIVLLASIITTWVVLRSRLGYALRAIKEDEDAARVLGINTTKYKILAFIMSATFAGAVGSLYWGLRLTAIYPPEVFNVVYTVESIIMVVLGGGGTLLGPLIGALIYAPLKIYLATVIPGLQLLILMPFLVAIITLMPHGIMGRLRAATRARIFE